MNTENNVKHTLLFSEISNNQHIVCLPDWFTSNLSDSSFSLCGISLGLPLRDSCRQKTGKKNSFHQRPITFDMLNHMSRGIMHLHQTMVNTAANHMRHFLISVLLQKRKERTGLTDFTN